MLKKILLGLGLILAGLLLYAAVIPGDFKIERSQEMSATAQQIYPHLNSPRLANSWSPFIAADPETKITYAGPESGVGANSSWVSDKMGEGTATIVETVPNQKVKVRLDFLKPFEGTNMVEYIIEPSGDKSRVTWLMTGHSNFLQRFICIFMNQDKMVGSFFEQGLKSLETKVSTTASL